MTCDFYKRKKNSTYRTPVHSIGCSVFSGLGHVGHSLLVGKILPDLGNLFDPLLPLGIVHLEVGVVDVGVKDHGNGGVLSQRFISLPFLEVVLSSVPASLSRGWRIGGSRGLR